MNCQISVICALFISNRFCFFYYW